MIRRLFLAMSVRERALLVGFISVILLLWLLSVLDGLTSNWREFSATRQQLATQRLMLNQADAAQASLEAARENVDTSRTYSAAQLGGELDKIARDSNLDFDLSAASTQESDLFSFHNVRLRIKKARISDLVAFDNEIKKRAPYITLTEFQITSDKRDPRNLDAIFKAESFELKPSALETR